ncbi:MAG: hypothetical protein KGL35_00855, partial [Bradyrhizobium sp.]|nr:hypothetical protein [Bradyrhizobium sp.]
MDQIQLPLFLLRADRKILYQNSAASVMLRNDGPFRKVGDRLYARRRDEEKRLKSLVRATETAKHPRYMSLDSRNGDPVFLLAGTAINHGALVMLRVAYLRQDYQCQSSWLCEAFGFSTEGAELADRILSGWSLAEFCDR